MRRIIMFGLWAALFCACSYTEKTGEFIESFDMATPRGEKPYFYVVGHRGYGKLTPENTLSALRNSIQDAVKVAEVDVRLTADGIPVLIHDDNLQRTTGDNYNPLKIKKIALTVVLHSGIF